MILTGPLGRTVEKCQNYPAQIKLVKCRFSPVVTLDQ